MARLRRHDEAEGHSNHGAPTRPSRAVNASHGAREMAAAVVTLPAFPLGNRSHGRHLATQL